MSRNLGRAGWWRYAVVIAVVAVAVVTPTPPPLAWALILLSIVTVLHALARPGRRR